MIVRYLLHRFQIVKRWIPFPTCEVLVAVDRACSLNKVVGTGEYFRKEGRGGSFGKVDDANSYIGYVNITMVTEIERMREEMGLREKRFQVGERKGGRP